MSKDVSIGINAFVRRQTAESKYSFFNGTDDELIGYVKQAFPLRKKGNREGSWIVPIIPSPQESKFFSAVIAVRPHMFLNAECVTGSRSNPFAKAITPLLCVSAVAPKQRGNFVNIVLWSSELLKKLHQSSTDCEYEIVSINVSDVEVEPEHPYEIARRVLNGKEEYSKEDICKSIIYWGEHVFAKRRFTRHIDKIVVEAIQNDNMADAVIRRQGLCPEESVVDSQIYCNDVKNFLASNGFKYH